MAGSFRLILPREELDGLIEKVEEGKITSLEAIEEFFAAMHSNYYDMEWTWAYDMLEEYYGVNLSSISAAQIVDLVRRWQDSVIGLDNLLYKDAKKEFSLTFIDRFRCGWFRIKRSRKISKVCAVHSRAIPLSRQSKSILLSKGLWAMS